MLRLLKYLPIVLPLIRKASRDPRVNRAIAKAVSAWQGRNPGSPRR